jgi:hypothetical protein
MYLLRSTSYIWNHDISHDENIAINHKNDLASTISMLNIGINNSNNINDLVSNILKYNYYKFFEYEDVDMNKLCDELTLSILKSLKYINNYAPKISINWRNLDNPYMGNIIVYIFPKFDINKFNQENTSHVNPNLRLNKTLIITKIEKYYNDIMTYEIPEHFWSNSVNIGYDEKYVYDKISFYLNFIKNIDIFNIISNSNLHINFNINQQIHKAIFKLYYDNINNNNNILTTYILIYTLLYDDIPREQLFETIHFFINKGAQINLNQIFLPLLPIIDDQPIKLLIDNNKLNYHLNFYKKTAVILDILAEINIEQNETINHVMMQNMMIAYPSLVEAKLINQLREQLELFDIRKETLKYANWNDYIYISDDLLPIIIDNTQHLTIRQVRLYCLKSYSRFLQEL